MDESNTKLVGEMDEYILILHTAESEQGGQHNMKSSVPFETKRKETSGRECEYISMTVLPNYQL